MSDDRKYKQRGYQHYDDQERGRGPSRAGMPRMPVITAYKETIRCDQCGTDLSTNFEVQVGSRCPKCEAPLHSCRNCYHFDTSARFQCARPVKEKISKKDGANQCDEFRVRTISVKDIGTKVTTRTEDARKALEDLFKK